VLALIQYDKVLFKWSSKLLADPVHARYRPVKKMRMPQDGWIRMREVDTLNIGVRRSVVQYVATVSFEFFAASRLPLGAAEPRTRETLLSRFERIWRRHHMPARKVA
jgi:hypothetical protein